MERNLLCLEETEVQSLKEKTEEVKSNKVAPIE